MNRFKSLSCKILVVVTSLILYVCMSAATVQAATTNYKYSYTLYGVELSPETLGEQTTWDCAKGASEILKKIFTYPKDYKLRYNCPYNILRDKSAAERTLTAEHIKKYINEVPLGARIRICASDNTTSNNNDNNREGHTQVLVDRTDNGFTVLECAKGTKMHAASYTWSDYVRYWNTDKKYGYIFYIMDFTSMIPQAYTAPADSAIIGYSKSDYGIPCLKETYPADNGEDGNWQLAGSQSYYYNQNGQMVLRYVSDEDGSPEEAYVYVYGENGPIQAYRYNCKHGFTYKDGTQEYLLTGHAVYTYNNYGLLSEVSWHYDDFVDYKRDHPQSLSDIEFDSHEITYEFQYGTTGGGLNGDYIWNHYEDLYFPRTVTRVQIKIDNKGGLASVYGYEEHNNSYNYMEPPVVALDYTCDSKGNITAVNCSTVSGPGSYSIEYELKDGHRQSAVQYDVFGEITGRETYTYYPAENMGNYMSTPCLEIDSVFEDDTFGNTKTIVLYCDSYILNNRTIKNTSFWQNDLENMPMLRTACGF